MPPKRPSSKKKNGSKSSSSSSFSSRDEEEMHAFAPWSRTVEENCRFYETSLEFGLSSAEVAKRQERFGANELTKAKGKSLLKLVLEQFDDALVKILLASAMVSFVLAFFEEGPNPGGGKDITAFVEPLVILLILVLNAIVGVWQETNAENALEALKEMQSPDARVIRNSGEMMTVPASELVVGDIVALQTGDRVPADLRVMELRTATLRCEQASLTGESVAVDKQAEDDELCPVEIELQGKTNIMFSGTAVSNGQCTGMVCAIGMNTEMGKIQTQIEEASSEEEDTPLKQKLDAFGEVLSKLIAIICLLVWLINYHHFISFENGSFAFNFAKCTYYFKIAVALAVAAIPEGLPAVITTCLALGTRKMAKQNAIVRKLPSVETLGCTSVICSDKTGTLTTNQMSAVKFVTADKSGTKTRAFNVAGTSYDPTQGGVENLPDLKQDATFVVAAQICAACNSSQIEFVEGSGYRCIGEPTEGALKILAEKIGCEDDAKHRKAMNRRDKSSKDGAQAVCDEIMSNVEVLSTLEFDRNRKSMSVICREKMNNTKKSKNSNGVENYLLAKGAPEFILERCTHILTPDGMEIPLTKSMRNDILKRQQGMASVALRCLALAIKSGPELGVLSSYDGSHSHPGYKILKDPSQYEVVESEMTFVGLAGLRDPPRPEVKDAINDCKKAGIRVIVITGDNKLTAEAICAEIGVFDSMREAAEFSFTGREFTQMTKQQRRACLEGEFNGVVFSRAEPKHKQDIVRLLREDGHIVAMTGDGVNDAPALKLADIGISMGIAGTEVAKEASDMILVDDNFSTIVSAVSEGRSIYDNMKAFIRYMISSNVGEVVSIFLTAALGLPEGLIPVQLLWVNLVTDGPPATALGFNPPDKDIMTKPPRRKDDELLTRWSVFRYAVVGLYVGIATVGVFCIWYTRTSFMFIDLSGDNHTTVSMKQLMDWENCASWTDGAFKGGSYSTAMDGPSFSFTGKNKCDYFNEGKAKASTLSLSVLVTIEMFNALNALSEDSSLFTSPPWINPYLLVAMFVSFGLHFVILYVPSFATIFSIVPLSFNEWMLVVLCALPVCIIDEVLKWFGRRMNEKELRARLDAMKNTGKNGKAKKTTSTRRRR
tara:strand:- start:794 stop:4138 length:3345 start_codon:yes stop_codon:yes gene_type:complete